MPSAAVYNYLLDIHQQRPKYSTYSFFPSSGVITVALCCCRYCNFCTGYIITQYTLFSLRRNKQNVPTVIAMYVCLSVHNKSRELHIGVSLIFMWVSFTKICQHSILLVRTEHKWPMYIKTCMIRP
jgi:hypothetical protein